jgi:hypothetical protein
MSCQVCGTPFTKRRPNSCQKCYFKKRHQEKYKKKARSCISCGEISELGHNVYCNKCKSYILNCEPHHRIYFGRKFYKNPQGYWVCCSCRKPWAHRWVWMIEVGEIPKGFDIHHKDGNKDNNDISNLELITRSEHQKKHWKQGDHDHEMDKRKEILAKWRKKHNNITK